MTEQDAKEYLLSLTPAERKAADAGWKIANDLIVERAAKRKPRPKVYEVYHEATVAQLAFLEALKGGDTPDVAAVKAAERVGIVPEGVN